MKDLTGIRFGHVTVLERAENQGKHAAWKCLCDCGRITCKRADYLKKDDSVSCGCMSGRETGDLTGRRFGHLTVLERAKNQGKHAAWKCLCDCGEITYKRADCLKAGGNVSCGCTSRRENRDLTGRRFGHLTVLGRSEKRGKRSVWKCRCDCGAITCKRTDYLTGDDNVSCGCMLLRKNEDLTGKRFGRLTALYRTEKTSSNGAYFWHCLCDCGNTLLVRACDLKDGNTMSCGCLQAELCRTKLKETQTYVDGTCIEFLAYIDKPTKANRTGVRGVCQRKDGRYEAYICFQRRQYHLGRFDRFEDAVSARKRGEEMVTDYLDAYHSRQAKAEL